MGRIVSRWHPHVFVIVSRGRRLVAAARDARTLPRCVEWRDRGPMLGPNRKDRVYFDAFSAHVSKSEEAARLLVAMLTRLPCCEAARAYGMIAEAGQKEDEDADHGLEELAKAIKEAEAAGDSITHETMKRLHENWITPLDRNDIHHLMSRLDDVLDEIEAAADRIVLFRVRTVAPEARELAEILVRSCEALAKAIGLLRSMGNAKDILGLCVEVNRLENAADQVHRKAISDLFRSGNDPLAVMKWRDILESLEAAADRCEDVANIIEGVVLEYA
jgi:uncharacterized protein